MLQQYDILEYQKRYSKSKPTIQSTSGVLSIFFILICLLSSIFPNNGYQSGSKISYSKAISSLINSSLQNSSQEVEHSLYNILPASDWFQSIKNQKEPDADLVLKKKIIIIESAGYHDEVTASFLFALRHQGHQVITKLFLDRFGASNLFKQLLQDDKVQSEDISKEWTANHGAKEVISSTTTSIIAVTCEKDLEKSWHYLEQAFQQGSVKLLCVVHHGDSRWSNTGQNFERAQKWLQSGRLEWVTLGRHVAESLVKESGTEQESSGGALKLHGAPIHVWSPIFALEDDRMKPDLVGQEGESARIIIQGKVEMKRRSYSQIFKEWQKMVHNLSSNYAVPHLIILGKVLPGKDLKIKPDIQDTVTCYKNLDYLSYYKTFEGASTILPAFSDDGYYVDKASSTVASSLITGIPLVGTKRLLESYSYLDLSNIYLREDEESEVDVVNRLLPTLLTQREAMRRNIFHTRDSLISENKRLIDLWTNL